MKDPGSAYDDPKLGGKDPQPGHMKDYVDLPAYEDNGGVHINSGIPNHAFYLVATQLGGNAWEDAGVIWYQTLLQLWPKAQFQDCANVSMQVAGALFGTGSEQQQAVKTAWSEVGITVAMPHPAARRRRAAASTGDGNSAELKRKLKRLWDNCHNIPNGSLPVHSEQWRTTVAENKSPEENFMSKQTVPPNGVARW